MARMLVLCALFFPVLSLADGNTNAPLLLQRPTLSRTEIVFAHAGDLWSVPRAGGEARRLTVSAGVEDNPIFSPDGSMIAFSGEYDGNVDVFVMPAAGGVPKRLTWHPGQDGVRGWTPDGKRILFSSARSAVLLGLFQRATRLPLLRRGQCHGEAEQNQS